MFRNDLAIVIPAYNEEATIKSVVESGMIHGKVIVVDDCSTDNTIHILKQLEEVVILRNNKNLGYESSLAKGIEHSIKMGYKYAITLDADGQLCPTLIPKFYNSLKAGYDVVIGQRDEFQRWSEGLCALIARVVWKISDPLCGLKAYRLEMLNNIELKTFDSIATELVIRMIKGKRRVFEIPISTKKREGESKFGSNSFKTNFFISKSFLKNFTNGDSI
jgi:glycosyltransferase involved in cell wall biosynthesis